MCITWIYYNDINQQKKFCIYTTKKNWLNTDEISITQC